jgi:hypothetical protein
MLRNIQKFVRKLQHTSALLPIESAFRHEKMLYFSQWESKDLVGKILRREMSAADDPLWKKSGAKTQREYEVWSWNLCGMACLRMILNHAIGKDEQIVVLGKKCMSYGGYILKKSEIEGLIYKPFVEFIKQEYGLAAKIYPVMLFEDILEALNDGQYIMVSVSPDIRHPDSTPQKKGGHLVVVVGYDYFKKLLFLHNPSGDTRESQEYAQISFGNFKRFFAERGVVIYKPK